MKILLHICCANCAVYPSHALRHEGHKLAGLWFNPNIHPYGEYRLRLDSLKGLADKMRIDIYFLEKYIPREYFSMFKQVDADLMHNNCMNGLKGFNNNAKAIPQSPERCKSCYRLRLEKTAEQASKEGFDAFTTTLLISPFQNFEQITAIGNKLADKYNVSFYLRDFRPYFRESLTGAKELGSYMQKYCGCIFSREERLKKIKNQKSKIKIIESLNFGF